MTAATITNSGRITIPKHVRDGLGLRPNDRLDFKLMKDGTVIIRARKHEAEQTVARHDRKT